MLESFLHGSQGDLRQFLLDPSVHPSIVILAQSNSDNILRVVSHLELGGTPYTKSDQRPWGDGKDNLIM